VDSARNSFPGYPTHRRSLKAVNKEGQASTFEDKLISSFCFILNGVYLKMNVVLIFYNLCVVSSHFKLFIIPSLHGTIIYLYIPVYHVPLPGMLRNTASHTAVVVPVVTVTCTLRSMR
jgi:hypothetical protein